jgi:hypothetical protein
MGLYHFYVIEGRNIRGEPLNYLKDQIIISVGTRMGDLKRIFQSHCTSNEYM